MKRTYEVHIEIDDRAIDRLAMEDDEDRADTLRREVLMLLDYPVEWAVGSAIVIEVPA